jgi:hypothetical protein
MNPLSRNLPVQVARLAPVVSKRPVPVTAQSFARQLVIVAPARPPVPAIVKPAARVVAGSQSRVTSQIPGAVAAPIGFNALVSGAGVPVQPRATTSVTHPYADDAADNDYWSKQPPAVQALREISDLDERTALGTQLAHDGYTIDVPIMVWGWDAGKTTALRQSNGYSWVPSALQQPVTAAPGVSGGGITPYDPAHPPSGSILVG